MPRPDIQRNHCRNGRSLTALRRRALSRRRAIATGIRPAKPARNASTGPGDPVYPRMTARTPSKALAPSHAAAEAVPGEHQFPGAAALIAAHIAVMSTWLERK